MTVNVSISVYQFIGLMWLVEYNAARAAEPGRDTTLDSMNCPNRDLI